MKKHLIFDLDGTVLDSYEKKKPYEKAEWVLAELRLMADLSLVTAGDSDVQWNKIETHDLKQYFNPIFVVKKKIEKFAAFSMFRPGDGIVAGHLRPEDVIVIGDRIEFEIAFGRKLGYTTVRIRQGPHSMREPHPDKPDEKPDIEIDQLYKLISLVKTAINEK